MNKFFKKIRVTLTLSIFIFMLIACSSNTDMKEKSEVVNQNQSTVSSSVIAEQTGKTEKYELKLKQETSHFIISYFSDNFTDKDKECIVKIENSLESGYERIINNYKTKFDNKKIVEIHNDHKQLHMAMGVPDAPDWACGGYGFGKILSASPLLPTPMTNYDCLVNTPLHEYVHLIVREINPDTPRWLNEGIAFFEAKDHEMSWVKDTVKAGIANCTIPTFEDLDTGYDFQAFAYKNGYQYMYTFIEFVTKEYGYSKLYKFIEKPDDFVGAFEVSKDELWNEWVEYLNVNYK